jgi:hypothetical protein
MYRCLIRCDGYFGFIRNDNIIRSYDFGRQGNPRNPDWHIEQPSTELSDEAAEDFARDYMHALKQKID